MKRSGILLIVLGLLLAVLSSISVYSLLSKQTPPPAVATPTPLPVVKVVVAAQDIPMRTILQAGMLVTKDWPQDLLPAGATSKPTDLVGRIVGGPLVAGEPVLVSKIMIEQEAIGLAPTLPPGLVATALSLQSGSAVGGAVKEGDSVDILVSLEYSLYNEKGDESKPVHATFYSIQDVPVLRVLNPEEAASGSATSTGSVAAAMKSSSGAMVQLTVLVTPQDALLLKYAREKGFIDVVLRSPQYHDQVVTDPIFLEYIMRRFELPKPVLIVRQATTTAKGEAE